MPSAAVLPRLPRRRLLTLVASAALVAAVAMPAAVVMRRPTLDVAVELAIAQASARDQARRCGPPFDALVRANWSALHDARAALASAHAMPPPLALRAQVVVLRTGAAFPACRATLFDIALSNDMMTRAEQAIRATWSAPELTDADRAAAVAALATIDASGPSVQRVIDDETDISLLSLAPVLRGRGVTAQPPATRFAHAMLVQRARWRAACPAETSVVACAAELRSRPGLDHIATMLRRWGDRQLGLDALRRELR